MHQNTNKSQIPIFKSKTNRRLPYHLSDSSYISKNDKKAATKMEALAMRILELILISSCLQANGYNLAVFITPIQYLFVFS